MRAPASALAVVLALTSAASAVELKPSKASSIDLGTYRGSVFYTPGRDGYRVVATLSPIAADDAPTPVIRLVTTLNADQTVTLSVPGALDAGGREATLAFSRRGDNVDVAAAE